MKRLITKAIKKGTFLLFAILIVSAFTGYGQSFQGPTCITVGQQYQYSLSYYQGSFNYSIVGGTVVGGSNSGSHAAGILTLQIVWGSQFPTKIIMSGSFGSANYDVSSLSSPLVAASYSGYQYQSINYNTTPNTISCNAPTGGSCTTPSYGYQWQVSSDQAHYTDISTSDPAYSGVNTLSLSFAQPMVQTTYYRLHITESSSASDVNTDGATVLVYPDLQAGTLSPSSQTINYGQNATNIHYSGASGGMGTNFYIYQWQISPDNSNWFDISQSGLDYAPTGLISSAYYRVMVTCNEPLQLSRYLYRFIPRSCRGLSAPRLSRSIPIPLPVSLREPVPPAETAEGSLPINGNRLRMG
ncbi:MAG: hypothetical protein JST68_14635 [Bacteroidetes bacterium]|nr:hypothetical protein [Bacteroidota bacterium]